MTTQKADIRIGSTAGDGVAQETATRLEWRAIVMFLVIALGSSWLLEIPVWLTGGISPGGALNPLFLPLTLAMMFTPAIAAVIVTLTLQRTEHPARFLGLVPLRPWRRTVGYSVAGMVGAWVLGVLAILLGGALGVVHPQTSDATVGALLTIPVASLGIAVAAYGEPGGRDQSASQGGLPPMNEVAQ